MNKIILTDEQESNIYKWIYNNRSILKTYYPYLLDGEIIVENDHCMFNVTESDSEWSVKLDETISDEGDLITYSLLLHIPKLEEAELSYEHLNYDDDSSDTIAADKSLIELYLSVNAYFFHFKQTANVEEKHITNNELRSNTKGKTYYQLVKRLEKRYTLKRISGAKIKPTHIWRVEAWQVCGHIRHLSDGRIVYVRPHVKGKGRDKIPNKTFKL